MAAQDVPVLTVSVAAELAGVHPQTVRQYDRLGLVKARRTAGRGRRYSLRDVEKLQRVQHMSSEEGISLNGIARILELEDEIKSLKRKLARAESERDAREDQLREIESRAQRVFAAGPRGEVRMASDQDELRSLLRTLDGVSYSVPDAEEDEDVAGYALAPIVHSTALIVRRF